MSGCKKRLRGMNELYSDSEFCIHSEFPQARRVCAAQTNQPQMAPLSPPHGGAPRVTDGGRNRAVAGLPVPLAVPRTLLLLASPGAELPLAPTCGEGYPPRPLPGRVASSSQAHRRLLPEDAEPSGYY